MADTIIAFDRYAARHLQTIRDRHATPASLLQTLASVLSPFAALESRYKTESELRDIFFPITTRLASRLPNLIDDAKHLDYLFRCVSNQLSRIKGLSLDEISETPKRAVLAELWVKLARPDDSEGFRSHQFLLNDIVSYYVSASKAVQDVVRPLKKDAI